MGTADGSDLEDQNMSSSQPAEIQLTPFQSENIATNQQAIPLPYLAGTRVIALRWITPATNEVTTQAQGGGKKG
jgi:hypothetical protein